MDPSPAGPVGGSFQSRCAHLTPTLRSRGHLQPGLGLAGVSQLFWGLSNSWFRQPSCAGARLPGPREPGAGLGLGLGQSAIAVTTVNCRDPRNVHFPSGRPSPGEGGSLSNQLHRGETEAPGHQPPLQEPVPWLPAAAWTLLLVGPQLCPPRLHFLLWVTPSLAEHHSLVYWVDPHVPQTWVL